MRPRGPELTDEDLRRLDRLGGSAARIAEAAGVDEAQVVRRLAAGVAGAAPSTVPDVREP